MSSHPASGSGRSQGPSTRLLIGFFALFLVFVEGLGIWQNRRVLDLYIPSHATVMVDAANRLMVAHVIRILVILSLLTGWRWSLWLTVSTYVIVYVPNPWIHAHLANPNYWPILLLPLILVALVADRQLLMPWRENEVPLPNSAANAAKEPEDA